MSFLRSGVVYATANVASATVPFMSIVVLKSFNLPLLHPGKALNVWSTHAFRFWLPIYQI